MNTEVQSSRMKVVSSWILLCIIIFCSCNQIQNSNQQNNSANAEVTDTATSNLNPGSSEKPSQQETEAEPSDSVMAKGNHVVFFMKNGEWANEIGAEEVATKFTEHALDAIDELERKGYKASFLIGEEIKIGMENEPTFRIDNAECVMGVVLTKTGNKNRLECGVGSATDFWNYFNEYYKPNL